MSDEPVYLDHNATTPLLPGALDAMFPFLSRWFGNPSSGHAFGRRTREAIERARAQVASLVGADADEVVFTSGGTESSNLAIRGVMAEAPPARGAIVLSSVEHPATVEACAAVAGAELRMLPVDAGCRVDLRAAASALDGAVALVSLMHANNETGAIAPIAEVARLARAVGAKVHVDGSQSVGKIPASMASLGADLLTIAGHKLGGPQGVGALVVRRGVALRPLARGAGHERGLRPGTENVAGIVGLGAACELSGATLEAEAARVRALRDALAAHLAAEVPGLRRTIPDPDGSSCLPNTLHVLFPGKSGDAILAATPEVAASTGSACHAGHVQASAVLLAMGLSPEEARGAVRLSLGRTTTAADVARAATALAAGFRRAG